MRKYIWEIGLILVSIIWGSGYVGTGLSLEGGLTPLQVITLRFVISAILINIIFFKKIKENITKKAIKAGIILGVFLFIAFAFQTIGFVYTTPSKNAFITAVNVVIVPFIGYLIYKRKIDKIGVISSIITLVGIGVLSLEVDFSVNIGDMLTLVCAVGFAFHIFFMSEFTKVNSPIVLTSVQFITVSILSFILQVVLGEGKIDASVGGYMGVIYLGIFSTTICFLVQSICQRKVEGTKTAIILSTEAVFGTLFSVILLGEVLTLRTVLGSLIIFIAIIMAETKLSFINFNKNNKDDKILELAADAEK